MYQGLTIPEILERFNLALARFIDRDLYLLEHDVSERAITHKLGEYLQPLFDGYNVDCEYNRNMNRPKMVWLRDKHRPEITRNSSIFPDVIVHRRGTNDHNKLIIESKKTNDTRNDGEIRDREKLIAYARDLNYVVGIFIVFDTNRSTDYWYRYSSYFHQEWQEEVNLEK